MAPSHWFFWAWWLPLMLAGVVADQHAEGCSGSAARCGNLTISDPFWLLDLKTGRSCGHRDFGVACYNNTPVLRSTEILGFAIIQMNYTAGQIRSPASRCGGDNVAGHFLASTAGQEPFLRVDCPILLPS
jgi:hypothetical protein